MKLLATISLPFMFACSSVPNSLSQDLYHKPVQDAGTIASPNGLYVLNYYPTSGGYPDNLFTSPGYNDVVGHAIFITLPQILPQAPIYDNWSSPVWDWTALDALVNTALNNGKVFSLSLVVGQAGLPSGFTDGCGDDCAPLFNVWLWEAQRCQSYNVPLPWVPRVEQFWAQAWNAMASHLRDTGAYTSLTLVHFAGLGVWDEEIRLPVDITNPCENATTKSYYQSVGYINEAQITESFRILAHDLLSAFPDRTIGMSFFPTGSQNPDFPTFFNKNSGEIASRIETAGVSILAGRLEVQMDNLGNQPSNPETVKWAETQAVSLGWQTTAACPTTECDDVPNDPNSFYTKLTSGGAASYYELWPMDVINYPVSLDTWKSNN
jgi:hypothetical protein